MTLSLCLSVSLVVGGGGWVVGGWLVVGGGWWMCGLCWLVDGGIYPPPQSSLWKQFIEDTEDLIQVEGSYFFCT